MNSDDSSAKHQTPNAERRTSLRILTLCYEWPPIGGGGGRAAKDIAEALVRRGHEVQVQTARFLGLPANEIVNGVHVHRGLSLRRNKDRSSPWEMGTYVLLNTVPAVHRIREFRPDSRTFCCSDRCPCVTGVAIRENSIRNHRAFR